MVAQMCGSYLYWLKSSWRKEGYAIAQDQANDWLSVVLKKLGKTWNRKFDEMAQKIASGFIDGSLNHNRVAMMGIMKDAGFVIDFKMTQAMKDAERSIIAENVALIKSIPAQFHTDIEKDVWRMVNAGGDMGAMVERLEKRFGKTHKRAVFIARDQNKKTFAKLEQIRREELGITEAIWMHTNSHKPQNYRESHVKAHGKKFDINKGMYLDGKWVLPAEEINCNCWSKAVIKGV